MTDGQSWLSRLLRFGRRMSQIKSVKTKKITWADNVTKHQIFNSVTPGGRIQFVDEGLESKDIVMEAKYLMVNDDTAEYLDDIAVDMAITWGMRTPKLVLTVISSSQYFKPWKRLQDEEDFQDGLMMAASLTDMWILTEGSYSGVNALIGKAVATERARRKILHAEQTLMRFISSERLPRLTVIGVVTQEDLSNQLQVDLKKGCMANKIMTIQIKASEKEEEEYIHQLNPNMTHFFVMTEESKLENFIFRLEMRLMRPVGKARRYFSVADSETEAGQTPLVGLLIQGGPRDINHVLTLLSKNVPVIVVCGQGMAADILAFAFRSVQSVGDIGNKESYIKTELLRRLTEVFHHEFKDDTLARNHCRDRILECVNYATQGDSVLLTLLDSQAQSSELRDLSKVILTAVLTSRCSQGVTATVTEQVQWNLQLTIDWKRPDLALSEIYNKYNEKIAVGDEQFQQVLLGPGRQEFVELFLNHGFILHKYLNSRRLELLFKMCEDRAFFAEICLETILGEKMTLEHPVPSDFLSGRECLLNQLLYVLTGLKHLIKPLQLSLNASNDRVETAAVAEQRALHALIYWAALTYNTKLLKILWGRTREPLAMALVLSTLHARLAKYWISDPDLQLKTETIGMEFGQLAVKMIDLNYQESKSQALKSLTAKLPDFKGYTSVDLAIIGKNKFFISHPCCQKYAYNLWYGSIRIQNRKILFFEIPEMIKIFLCLTLIFPTYYWIDIVLPTRPQIVHRQKIQMHPSFYSNLSDETRWKSEALLVVKLYYIWIAPVTQFWISQLFFLVFLALFAFALSQPYCGDPLIHQILMLWLIVLFVDNLYSLLTKKLHCREFSIKVNLYTMIVITYTACIVIVFRVLHFTTISFTTVKFMLSLSLIYFFYYAMFQFYPVSQTLGPMLVNITVMVFVLQDGSNRNCCIPTNPDITSCVLPWSLTLKVADMQCDILYSNNKISAHCLINGILELLVWLTLCISAFTIFHLIHRDLINWLKLWSLALISGSVAIHAVLYPAETLDLQVALKVILRGIFALFMTDISDVKGEQCSCLYNYTSQYGCNDQEIPQVVKDSLSTCPRTSAGGYLIVLQYIYHTKLIFNTLIFAMCSDVGDQILPQPSVNSVTMARTYQAVLEIWKYQFFMLVQEFFMRPPLPVPLVVLVYPALLFQSIFTALYHIFLTCCPCGLQTKKIAQETYNMWNAFIKLHKKQEKITLDKLNENKTIEQRLTFIAQEQKSKDKQISSLNDRLVEVLNSQTSMFLMMEHMKNVLMSSVRQKAHIPVHSTLEIFQHSFSRRSPYPATAIRRFAVFDKYLPWEENYPNYDPPVYSQLSRNYDEEMILYMDPDLVALIAQREVYDSDTENTDFLVPFEPQYNAVKEDQTITGEIFTTDRVSWITKEDQPIQYTIDASDTPRNPMGRTGIRGRGNLWRYGPNHMMFAVISRWKSSYNSEGVVQGHLLVGGKRVKEILVVNNPVMKEYSLPGGFVSGRTSCYSVMCEVFMRDILGEKDVPGSITLDQDDMILFFRQFVSSDFILSGILGMNISASTSFSSKRLFRGYLDDPNNTDNAWVEAEVWSFHYHNKDKFDKKIPQSRPLKSSTPQREKYWRDVSRWMQLAGYHLPFVLEVDDLYND